MEPMIDKLLQSGATGIALAVCVLLYKWSDVYLKMRKAKKMNGSADHSPSSSELGDHLERSAVVQRDSLELLRSIRHELEQGQQRIETKLDALPAQTALHIAAGRVR